MAKRKATKQQLMNLAKGRAILQKMRGGIQRVSRNLEKNSPQFRAMAKQAQRGGIRKPFGTLTRVYLPKAKQQPRRRVMRRKLIVVPKGRTLFNSDFGLNLQDVSPRVDVGVQDTSVVDNEILGDYLRATRGQLTAKESLRGLGMNDFFNERLWHNVPTPKELERLRILRRMGRI